MKDKMKVDKPNVDVKCVDTKPQTNGLCEQKNFFKIGEYNRATASFEMKSSEDLREGAKPKFDLSSEVAPCHYFKSSFARSMVVNNSNKSKSLDYSFANRNGYTIKEESSERTEDASMWMPGKENWDLRRAQPAEIRDDDSTTESLIAEQPSAIKKTEIIEEHLRNQGFLGDRPASRGSYQKLEKRFEEVLLRSPLTASCRSSFYRPYSSASDVDSVMLQSQVTTLQWQLRQAEASRQMYRAVMEQVVSFLQKTHKNLDLLQNRLEDDVDTVTRVPRSRSVHAVHTSPTRFPSSKTEINLSFQKAKSYAQIGDPDCPKHGAMFRETSWRRVRKHEPDVEEINPSKLSEEAFRLLRTVKSLLSTREPDLASRLSTTSPANVSSASSTVSAALDSDNSDFPPPLRQSSVKEVKDSRRRSKGDLEAKGGSPPQLSISSADDESGFSSLNSFQEIGLPVSNSTFIQPPKVRDRFQEVGLPKVDEGCKVHRRWNSTPADNHLSKIRPPSLCGNGDVIRVLWV